MKRDVNNIPVLIKEIFILTPFQHLLGTLFINVLNKLKVEGKEILKQLPDKNVLFVSNHQTYFMEGIALMTEFDHILQPVKHWCWKAITGHCYYIVALETAQMKGWVHRVIEWGGAVTVTRTWKKSNQDLGEGDVSMEQVEKDQGKVIGAIKDGWVITFPQGTTTPFTKGRKGTAHIIKLAKCIVVPVVVDGFSDAFHKSKPCWPIKLGSRLKIRFKSPLDINYDDSEEDIVKQIMDAIEQSDRFRPLSGDFADNTEEK
jgi:1-acyl-sn-glycerol-3-phosphate acyltransferase